MERVIFIIIVFILGCMFGLCSIPLYLKVTFWWMEKQDQKMEKLLEKWFKDEA